jgi:hypothetical protein
MFLPTSQLAPPERSARGFLWTSLAYDNAAAPEVREVYSGGNAIVECDINGDKKPDFNIALHGHFLLTSGDFIL